MTTLHIVANIIGYIGLVMLYIQLVFGSRHIFKFFTRDTVFVNKMHMWVGKYAIFAVMLHPILSMANRLEDIFWIFIPNFSIETESHITLGRFALVLFVVVWTTSAIVRGKVKWRPWKWVHLLAYPILILSIIHMKDIGSFYEDYDAIKFLWMFMLITTFFSIVIRLLFWAGILKTKYILEEKKIIGDIYMVKLKPAGDKLLSKIGQHFYLQTGKFKSEHPFSIIRNQDGTLSFGIRKVAGFWNELEKKQIGDTVFVDGPYGVFTKEAQNENKKVIISAGVGITPFIELIEKHGKGATHINCNRSLGEVIERDMLKSNADVYVDLVDNGEASENVFVQKIDKDIIKKVVKEEYIKNTPFFVCGSPGFISFVKKILSDVGVPKKNIYLEELGF